jgi:hypothetical protein
MSLITAHLQNFDPLKRFLLAPSRKSWHPKMVFSNDRLETFRYRGGRYTARLRMLDTLRRLTLGPVSKTSRYGGGRYYGPPQHLRPPEKVYTSARLKDFSVLRRLFTMAVSAWWAGFIKQPPRVILSCIHTGPLTVCNCQYFQRIRNNPVCSCCTYCFPEILDVYKALCRYKPEVTDCTVCIATRSF